MSTRKLATGVVRYMHGVWGDSNGMFYRLGFSQFRDYKYSLWRTNDIKHIWDDVCFYNTKIKKINRKKTWCMRPGHHHNHKLKGDFNDLRVWSFG